MVVIVWLLAVVGSQAEPVPSGQLYAFGKIGVESMPTVIDGAIPFASFVQNKSQTFRAVGPGPNVASVIDKRGMAWRFDDASERGTLRMPVEDPGEWEFCQICRGSIHTVAVTCDGRGFTWGGRSRFTDPDGPIGPPLQPIPIGIDEKILQIACGANHTLVLSESRTVYSFGDASTGRLGLAYITEADTRFNTPQVVVDLQTDSLDDDEVCYVSAGGASSFAITKNGRMFSWGANFHGQLGLNVSDEFVTTPTVSESDPEFFACEVASNEDFAIGYDDKGDIWAWGAGFSTPSRFGNAPDMKAFLGLLESRAMMVATGQYHMSFLTDNHEVYTLGYNRYGQLGVRIEADQPLEKAGDFEPDSPMWTLTPQLVGDLSGKNISSIFSSGNYTLALGNLATPHNCPCARGGRQPTQFYFPPSIESTLPTPPPQQPERGPSNVFGPVAPFVSKHRQASKLSLPGEVSANAKPRTMDEFAPLNMFDGVDGQQNPRPELPAKPATFFYYPSESDEAKAFTTGVRKGEVDSIFGRDVTPEGYFYGDYDAEGAADPSRKALMPAVGGERMPEPSEGSDMSTQAEFEDSANGVLSLSMQDVKAPRVGSDNMRQAVFDAVNDLKDNLAPVDFSPKPGDSDLQSLVRISGALTPLQPE
jgi:alpha-tubulin suppressor-like RCC1 family protein